MRYQLMFDGRAVAQSEYRDLAEAAATNSPVPVTITDIWLNEDVLVPPKPQALLPFRLPDESLRYMIDVEGKKIQAIKIIREITGWGLGDSKAYADRLQYRA